MVTSLDGQTLLQHEMSGTDPQTIATELANHLIERGALDIIEQVNRELKDDDSFTS